MSAIYLATKDVVLGGDTGHDHLYLVYDPDNNPNNSNEYILRVGYGSLGPYAYLATEVNVDVLYTYYTYGAFDVEIAPIGSSSDGGGSSSSRYYNKLNLNGLEASNVWSYFLAHASAIDDASFDYILVRDNATGSVVDPDGITQNSNSFIKSLMNTIGLSANAYVPQGAGFSWPGLSNGLYSVVPPSDGYEIDSYHYLLGNGGSNNISGSNASHKYVMDGGNGIDALVGNALDDFLYGGAGNSDPSYYKSYASINACGLGSLYSYGSPESEESYHFDVQRNLKHWKE